MQTNKLNKNRFIKSLIVGAIGTIPNYVVFIFLRNIHIDIAWGLGIFSGAISNYILNEYWTWG